MIMKLMETLFRAGKHQVQVGYRFMSRQLPIHVEVTPALCTDNYRHMCRYQPFYVRVAHLHHIYI